MLKTRENIDWESERKERKGNFIRSKAVEDCATVKDWTRDGYSE